MVGITMLLIILGLSGCTQQNSSNEQTITPTTESIQALLTKAETINSMYYQIAATITMSQYGTQTATIKIWQKAPYLKVEMNGVAAGATNTITIIQRPEGTYTYDTAQGKYVLTTDDLPSFATSLQYFNPEMIKKYLNNQSLTNFETDTIDGKKATIIQYTPTQGEYQMIVKIWIWNEKGVPLKAYFTMVLEEYTMTMDFNFNNYSFADIPDSTFSVS